MVRKESYDNMDAKLCIDFDCKYKEIATLRDLRIIKFQKCLKL